MFYVESARSHAHRRVGQKRAHVHGAWCPGRSDGHDVRQLIRRSRLNVQPRGALCLTALDRPKGCELWALGGEL